MRERPKIPNPAARRLSLYLRKLEARKDAKLVSINSSQLGEALGLTGAQAQKDFATFGTFGTFGRPSVGYTIIPLCEQLSTFVE
jgi:NADH/NAD ratio-sensing transcriptional regulator Rex